MEKEKYLELKYFCLQYNEKKKLANLDTKIGRKARTDVRLIEWLIREVDVTLYDYLLDSIIHGKNYYQTSPPCGRRQFYNKRHKFFERLAEYR